MYIPEQFSIDEREEAMAFIDEFPFGTLISRSNTRPLATHLPFVVEQEGGTPLLSSHWAKANEQWSELDENEEVLAIFSGPNAYISPAHYDEQESVPTWDYIAVHAYGTIERIEQEDKIHQLLEKMIHRFEPGYEKQWQGLSEEYRKGLMAGLKAFQFRVNELQGQAKLSQEKSSMERERIADQLAKSSRASERLLALYMKV